MSTKLKGVFKGLKLISQIFVVKESSNNIEIGHPTDVKHVAHIGWESPTGPSSSPSWLGDYSSTMGTPSNSRDVSRETSWTSQDFEQSRDGSVYSLFSDTACSEPVPCPDIPKPPKNTRRKKSKSKANSPASSARSSRSSRSKESFSTTVENFNDLRTEIRFV
ncbi:CRIB domain-containing protein RIC10-like [Carex rostrata]